MDPTHDSDVVPTLIPDPAFWGPEPRSVRRSRRGSPPRHHIRAHARQRSVDSVRERLRDTRVEFGAGIAAIVVVALVAGLVWYRMSAGGAAPPVRSEASAVAAPRRATRPQAPASVTTRRARCHRDGARGGGSEDPRCARAPDWRPSHRRRRGCGRGTHRRRPRPLEPCCEADRRPASAGQQGRGTASRVRVRRVGRRQAPRR